MQLQISSMSASVNDASSPARVSLLGLQYDSLVRLTLAIGLYQNLTQPFKFSKTLVRQIIDVDAVEWQEGHGIQEGSKRGRRRNKRVETNIVSAAVCCFAKCNCCSDCRHEEMQSYHGSSCFCYSFMISRTTCGVILSIT